MDRIHEDSLCSIECHPDFQVNDGSSYQMPRSTMHRESVPSFNPTGLSKKPFVGVAPKGPGFRKGINEEQLAPPNTSDICISTMNHTPKAEDMNANHQKFVREISFSNLMEIKSNSAERDEIKNRSSDLKYPEGQQVARESADSSLKVPESLIFKNKFMEPFPGNSWNKTILSRRSLSQGSFKVHVNARLETPGDHPAPNTSFKRESSAVSISRIGVSKGFEDKKQEDKKKELRMKQRMNSCSSSSIESIFEEASEFDLAGIRRYAHQGSKPSLPDRQFNHFYSGIGKVSTFIPGTKADKSAPFHRGSPTFGFLKKKRQDPPKPQNDKVPYKEEGLCLRDNTDPIPVIAGGLRSNLAAAPTGRNHSRLLDGIAAQ